MIADCTASAVPLRTYTLSFLEVKKWVLDLIIASSIMTRINTITASEMFWLYGTFGVIGLLLVLHFVP